MITDDLVAKPVHTPEADYLIEQQRNSGATFATVFDMGPFRVVASTRTNHDGKVEHEVAVSAAGMPASALAAFDVARRYKPDVNWSSIGFGRFSTHVYGEEN